MTVCLRLERVAAIGDLCILGRLSTTSGADGGGCKVLAKTLELPWRDNAPCRSRIPPGIYTITPRHTQKFGRHYQFANDETAPRYAILMHVGNRAQDVEGCVLVGKTFGLLMHEPAVLHSRAALNDLLAAYPLGFTLHIEGIG